MSILTGNNFKKECNFFLDEFGFGTISQPSEKKIPKYFVKTDYIDLFFNKFKPNKKFILLTHNSDFHITEKHKNYLDDNLLEFWFAQNVDYVHPKLKSIPIGIANEKWPHGDVDILNEIISKSNKKTQMVYCNFDINTNYKERSLCLKTMNQNGLKMSQKKDFKNYLEDLSKSFFVLSPNGNGVDCHKTWESLYLKTIPIVTDSININFYKNLPLMIIKKWEDLNFSLLNEDLYYKIWKNYNPSNLTTNFFI
jgi:hypothetical protein